jgi:hypothetical protein
MRGSNTREIVIRRLTTALSVNITQKIEKNHVLDTVASDRDVSNSSEYLSIAEPTTNHASSAASIASKAPGCKALEGPTPRGQSLRYFRPSQPNSRVADQLQNTTIPTLIRVINKEVRLDLDASPSWVKDRQRWLWLPLVWMKALQDTNSLFDPNLGTC